MEIKGDQVASKQCIMAAIKQHPPGAKQKGKIAAECSKGLWQLEDGEDACPERSNESCEPCKELELIAFSLDPEKYFQVGHSLDVTEWAELISFLVSNLDVFAWDPYEVLEVDSSYI